MVYSAANNRAGDPADANGNIGLNYVYDIENRLVQPAGTTISYSYDAANKRVWRGDLNNSIDELAFYGVSGQKLGTYSVSVVGIALKFYMTGTRAYFGAKLLANGTNGSGNTDHVLLTPVAADRLGSIGKFYPYRQERPSATMNDKEKFTGYYRDAATGLDYADQRYHQSGMGRFMSPDKYQASARPSDPGSWNRYAYTRGDPVNRVDVSGLADDEQNACTLAPNSPGCVPFGYELYSFGGGGDDLGWQLSQLSNEWFWSYLEGLVEQANAVDEDLPFTDKAPKVLGTGSDQHLFSNAFGKAEKLLGKSDCAGMFGYGSSSSDLQSRLANADFEYSSSDSQGNPISRDYVAVSTVGGNTMTINKGATSNFFATMDQNLNPLRGVRMFGVDLSMNDYRAFVLLDELGHLIGFGPAWDEASNQKLILTDCFGKKPQ